MINATERRSRLFLGIFLTCVGAVLPAAALVDTVYVPGQAYFGRNQYIEYDAGELPIILTAAHGGHELPEEIPDRTWGTTTYDTNTQELIRELYTALYQRTGKYPHVIINRLHRRKLDANREVVEAAQGNVYAIQAWNEFHTFATAAYQSVLKSSGKGFYVDIHGHGHTIQRAEVGYLLSASQLALSEGALNQPSVVAQASVRTLAGTRPGGLAALLRGPLALGTFLENRGYPAVPSSMQYSPGADPYFTGGYNTERYGSVSGGTIDGVQIELNYTGVRDTEANYKRFAQVLAGILDDFVQIHYFARPTPSQSLVINEVLFDIPRDDTGTPAIEGDVNGDGMRSVRGDEFVEIVNTGSTSVDAGGYQILERNMTPVFTFPAGTMLQPQEYAVVFGGVGPGGFGPGLPAGVKIFAAKPGLADSGFHYSSGKTNLLTAADHVVLYNPSTNDVADEVCWGTTSAKTVKGKKLVAPYTLQGDSIAGAIAQSVTRSPDVTGLWVRHSFVAKDSVACSPGTPVPTGSTSVPVLSVPARWALGQNYPNPFNPVTTIEYSIGPAGGAGPGEREVRLVVYDLLGRVVATLVDGPQAPGTYAVRFDAGGLSSGVYVYRLTAGEVVQVKRMVLTR